MVRRWIGRILLAAGITLAAVVVTPAGAHAEPCGNYSPGDPNALPGYGAYVRWGGTLGCGYGWNTGGTSNLTIASSPNGNYYLWLQGDGNLVAYGPTGARWATNTSGHTGATLSLQSDGNMVIREAGTGAVLWYSGAYHYPGPWRLVFQDDATLAQYQDSGAWVWTAGDGALPW